MPKIPGSRPQAILWDNDGVLVNTEHLFYEVNRDFFLEHQIDLTPQHFFDWYLQDNCGAWHLLPDPTPERITLWRNERNRRYSARLLAASELATPDIDQVLSSLGRDFRMGVVTSSRGVDFHIIHQNLNLLRHFEFIVTDDDVSNSKPSPEPYLAGLRRARLPAEACLVVEDSPRGIQAANAAGIPCIAMRGPLTAGFDFAGAWKVVDSNLALLDAIQNLR